jgi:hypothetical protein
MGTVLDLQNPWVLGRWVCEQRWRLRGDDQGLRLWWQWPGINDDGVSRVSLRPGPGPEDAGGRVRRRRGRW